MTGSFQTIAAQLAQLAGQLYARGWMFGTSGNLSAVVTREPLTLAITPSGAHKGAMEGSQILLVDEHARPVIESEGRPSDEALLHLSIASARGAGAVIHTHSIWSTILSDVHADEGGLSIEGFEMLKGLSGVTTHQHREWLPIVDNSQDMGALAETVRDLLATHKNCHGLLLRKHGLYCWGRDLREAQRHVEILEFLLEAVGRTRELSR